MKVYDFEIVQKDGNWGYRIDPNGQGKRDKVYYIFPDERTATQEACRSIEKYGAKVGKKLSSRLDHIALAAVEKELGGKKPDSRDWNDDWDDELRDAVIFVRQKVRGGLSESQAIAMASDRFDINDQTILDALSRK